MSASPPIRPAASPRSTSGWRRRWRRRRGRAERLPSGPGLPISGTAPTGLSGCARSIGMDDVKIGEILLPGDEEEQESQRERVRKRFWPVLRRAFRQVPFSRDLVAAYYCALDRRTPTRVRGILL